MLARVQCNYSFNCTFEEPQDYSAEFGALPVATRCWADYEPDMDTSSAFSCTASDTCRVGTTDYGATLNEFGDLVEDENQIVCDSCPLQPGGLVNKFGCDTYTKQCTCNRYENPPPPPPSLTHRILHPAPIPTPAPAPGNHPHTPPRTQPPNPPPPPPPAPQPPPPPHTRTSTLHPSPHPHQHPAPIPAPAPAPCTHPRTRTSTLHPSPHPHPTPAPAPRTPH
jgi:hypothetical protein